MNSTTPPSTAPAAAWPMPVSYAAAPMRWVLTTDPHNCSGIPCPVDTFCMRPEPYKWPNYCVHKQAMQDVPELLAKGPAMIYCEEIGQAVLAFILALIFLVQFAHFLVYYWRTSSLIAVASQTLAQHQQNQRRQQQQLDGIGSKYLLDPMPSSGSSMHGTTSHLDSMLLMEGTEMRPLMGSSTSANRAGEGRTNLSYEQSLLSASNATATTGIYEPSYFPFQQV